MKSRNERVADWRARQWISIAMLAAVSALPACAEHETQSVEEAKVTASGQELKSGNGGSAASFDANTLGPVFGSMEAVGRHASEKFEKIKDEFLARPDATRLLKNAYESAPKNVTGRTMRWKAAHLASKLRTAEAVQLLERVSLSNDAEFSVAGQDSYMQGPGASEDNDEGGRTTELPSRIEAAFGLVHCAIENVSGAQASLSKVLRSAEDEVSRMAAVELFANGKLSSEHRAALTKRGISTNFRKHTPQEAEEVRRIDTSELPRRDGKPVNVIEPPKVED